MIKIFRIENLETMNGMWYDGNGKYNPFIEQLTEGISRELPMEEHERYGLNGKRWFSGCENIDDMRKWFSARDALELSQSNYQLFQYSVDEFVREDSQVLFTRDGIKEKKILLLQDVWDMEEVE